MSKNKMLKVKAVLKNGGGKKFLRLGQGNISEDETGESEQGSTGSDWDNIPSAIGEVWDATNDEGKPMSDAEMQELKGEIQRGQFL